MLTKIGCAATLALCAMGMLLGEPPPWVLKIELVCCTGAALLFGYSVVTPPSWLLQRPILGLMALCLGCVSLYLPPQFLVSATFIGTGCRLLFSSFDEARVRVLGSVARSAEIVRRPDGTIVRGG